MPVESRSELIEAGPIAVDLARIIAQCGVLHRVFAVEHVFREFMSFFAKFLVREATIAGFGTAKKAAGVRSRPCKRSTRSDSSASSHSECSERAMIQARYKPPQA
jgi:hypothetical protein